MHTPTAHLSCTHIVNNDINQVAESLQMVIEPVCACNSVSVITTEYKHNQLLTMSNPYSSDIRNENAE